jgi:hypothetical protein
MTLKLLKYDLRSLFKRFALLWPAALSWRWYWASASIWSPCGCTA